MLVLKRKIGEKVVVNCLEGMLVLQILSLQHNQVKLGFIAPPEIAINREEVAIKKAKV